jgi:hypothetical protein
MKTKLLIILATLTVPLAARAQGSLTPPGPPGPTMLTLSQVEPRTPISSAPFTISQPGSYFLTTNLTVSSGNAITISANGVTLDLNGFAISSTDTSLSGYGIELNGVRDISIANGFIQGGVTDNGSGSYSGGGFYYGIYYAGSVPGNVRVSGISVYGCQTYGIFLFNGSSTLVESCLVSNIAGYGIVATMVKDSTALNCGNTAINGAQVSGCCGQTVGVGEGISGFAAQNCYGAGVNGYGVAADIANNCYGVCTGGGTGVEGIDIAIGCVGISASGTGLSANIGNSCVGQSTTGTAENVTYKYNMP